MLDEKLVHYFELERSIHNAYKRIRTMRANFYDQSFHTTMNIAPEDKQGFVLERDTVEYLYTLEKLENNVKKRKEKYQFFVQLLTDLPTAEKEYLFNRFIFYDNIERQPEIELRVKRQIKRYEGEMKKPRIRAGAESLAPAPPKNGIKIY